MSYQFSENVNRFLARTVLDAALENPAGGSVDLHSGPGLGKPFEPDFDCFIVGGVTPVVIMSQVILSRIKNDTVYAASVYENLVGKIASIIDESDRVGGEIVGWWQDTVTGNVYFDISDYYRTDFFDSDHASRVAMQRGELAIAFYNAATRSTVVWRDNMKGIHNVA